MALAHLTPHCPAFTAYKILRIPTFKDTLQNTQVHDVSFLEKIPNPKDDCMRACVVGSSNTDGTAEATVRVVGSFPNEQLTTWRAR